MERLRKGQWSSPVGIWGGLQTKPYFATISKHHANEIRPVILMSCKATDCPNSWTAGLVARNSHQCRVVLQFLGRTYWWPRNIPQPYVDGHISCHNFESLECSIFHVPDRLSNQPPNVVASNHPGFHTLSQRLVEGWSFLYPHSQGLPSAYSPPTRWGLLDFMSDARLLLPPSSSFLAGPHLPALDRSEPRRISSASSW